MSKGKIQLIGKVSGLNRGFVLAKFNAQKKKLESEGYEVWSPVDHVPEDATQVEAMRICLANLVLPETESVSVQPDWVNSEGAKVEYMVANSLRLKIIRV